MRVIVSEAFTIDVKKCVFLADAHHSTLFRFARSFHFCAYLLNVLKLVLPCSSPGTARL